MTDDDKPTHIRLVVENEHLAQNADKPIFARQELQHSLKELAANLMRVSRGAGRPYKLGRECLRVVEALNCFLEAADHWPSDELISEAIACHDYREEAHSERREAIGSMVEGALQLAASRQLRQIPQERMGENQMLSAARRFVAMEERQLRVFHAKHGLPRKSKKRTPLKKREPTILV